ncbi:cation:proton antiporter [Propionibacterium sp.]|uniref:cation:proton antiporter n=1 Tax=Propionibacterium sp. TaxID=1977903 RepID=UPI0039ED007E
MDALIVCALVLGLLWSVIAEQLARWLISGPLFFVLGGMLASVFFGQNLAQELSTTLAEKMIELILAVTFFSAAIEVRGGLNWAQAKLVIRLLFIALPLSIAFAFFTGRALLPHFPWAVVLVLACILIPTDFSTAGAMLRDERIHPRLRNTLNVESGYNGGLVSPLFVFALAVAEGTRSVFLSLNAVEHAAWWAILSILVGLVIGSIFGWLVAECSKYDFMTAQSVRVGILALPLVTYAVAVGLNSNGFVAAFVAGISYRFTRARAGGDDVMERPELALVDDIGVFATAAIWFLFGCVSLTVLDGQFRWRLVLMAILALTVFRILPVFVSLIGSQTSWRERAVMGLVGPRGIAAIMCALLAFNTLDHYHGMSILYAGTFLVFGSLLMHGIVDPLITGTVLGIGRSKAPKHVM